MTFVTDLWESIFTPGTTPALVRATHFSFAALVLLLISLLVATWNLHFLALLVIASGLWAAVTWFVGELEAEKARQAEAARASGTTLEKTPEPAAAKPVASGTDSAKSPRIRRKV
jgi:hypothetical protein